MILKLFVDKMKDNEIILFMYCYSRNRIVAFFYFVILQRYNLYCFLLYVCSFLRVREDCRVPSDLRIIVLYFFYFLCSME